ncbi:MAG: alpha/beta hydrolase [Thermosynechococcaceae cyanobacterium]
MILISLKNRRKPLREGLLGRISFLGFTLLCLNVSATQAAERIHISYGLLERSVSVSALEIYAKEGRITGDLIPYARYLNADQRQKLRAGLQAKIDLSPVSMAQFFYTPIGEELLQRVGQVVYPKSRQGSLYALRSALILSAAEPQGLTFLNFLQNYPTEGLQIDLNRGFTIFGEGQKLIKDTAVAVSKIEAQTISEPATSLIKSGQSLASTGPYRWQKISLELNDNTSERIADTGKARQFPADVYLPQTATPKSLPVVVISHGLNSDRSSFAYLAEHLASHGFVVAVPAHPGSDTKQLEALLSGASNDVAPPTEFVDRPLDVKFLLDELERRSQSDPAFQGRLNLKQVGVIGQSYGGYTALALAGAPINQTQLRADCSPKTLSTTLNLSVLLQCKATRLPVRQYNLADDRVKAIMVINPIDSVVFGQKSLSQIKIPVMMISGSADTVAPALPEQIEPFTWLTTPKKYFVLMNGGTHFSTIDDQGDTSPEADVLPDTPAIVGPDPGLARRYVDVLGLAMMNTYIAGRSGDQQYLTPGYVKALSQQPLPLTLTQSISLNEGSNTPLSFREVSHEF